MVFSRNRKLYNSNDVTIFVNNKQVKQVNKTKFLGVIIDDSLNWAPHIDYIKSKISKTIGILYKARTRLYTDSLKTLYTAMVYPYLSYCVTIWGYTYKKYINKLYIIQKKILRLITFSEYRAHSKPLFLELKLLNIYQIYTYFTCIFVFKYYQILLPDIFKNVFEINANVHNYNTRNSQNLRSQFVETKICSFSVSVQGPSQWNKLNDHLKQLKTLPQFKKQLRKYLLDTF